MAIPAKTPPALTTVIDRSTAAVVSRISTDTDPAPITPATTVPGAMDADPLIGWPGVGDIPSKENWNSPIPVLNLDSIVSFDPLLTIEYVGCPMFAPVKYCACLICRKDVLKLSPTVVPTLALE